MSSGAGVEKLQRVYIKIRLTKSPTNLNYDIFSYLWDTLHACEHKDAKMKQETSCIMKKNI